MWTVIGIIFILITGACSFGNEKFAVPNIMDILESKPTAGISEICSEHLKNYLEGIKNLNEPWALQMIDSITKFPDGILMGRSSFPGHYDECVNAVNENFSGKHCMIKLLINTKKENSDLLNLYYKREGEQSMSLKYGICIPSTCNSTDIKNVILSLGLEGLKIDLNETDCSVSGFRSFRTEDWVVVVVLVVFFMVALASTVYDLFQRFKKKNENPHQLWSSFSIYTNGKALFKISQSTSQLKSLHGVRFLSMCWVILGHSYFSFLSEPPINMGEVWKLLKDKSFVPVSNTFVSVDSFFFLSGLLVCLVFFRSISTKKTFDFPVAFIHRYMRLTPPFAILMLIQGTIISRIGDGPFWNAGIDRIEDACRESWWTGILYVQNYLKPMAMCLGQAWYLSADMQMYWISPLILYPLFWFPYFAPYFLLLLVLVAASTNFAISFVNNLGPNLLLNLDPINQFKLEYVPFYTRMAPWLIGLATGYIICGIQANKIKLNLPKIWVLTGWIATGFLLGGSLFGITKFFSHDYSQVEASLYLAFHRVGWALGMSWVVVACVGGYGGLVNDFLSLDIFQPLGRLSYCNFLIHMTIQNYRVMTSRTNQYLRHFEAVYFYFGDLLISNLISIPVVLLFEFPFTNIDRHFLQKLVIFPIPKPAPKAEKEISEENSEVPKKFTDAEKGKENPTFNES